MGFGLAAAWSGDESRMDSTPGARARPDRMAIAYEPGYSAS